MYKYMFLKQERPEMILKEKKTLVIKENFNILRKYIGKNVSVFIRTPFQKLHKIFLHILLFQTILSIFYNEEKTYTF